MKTLLLQTAKMTGIFDRYMVRLEQKMLKISNLLF